MITQFNRGWKTETVFQRISGSVINKSSVMRQELSNLFHISIVCLIICRPVLSGINQFCDKQSSVNQCSFAALDFWINSKDNLPISEEESGTGEGKFEMAVVLYNEESILPLHKSQRTFNFVSRDIQIKQNWAELGVAAVVWDAVCIVMACQNLETYIMYVDT